MAGFKNTGHATYVLVLKFVTICRVFVDIYRQFLINNGKKDRNESGHYDFSYLVIQ